jgi:hypothetical protein
LVGLLLLSYMGSSFGRKRRFRVASLSGVEHVVLGLVLGPLLLGLIERSWTKLFEPIVLVGAAWLGFVAGAQWPTPDTPRFTQAWLRSTGFGLLLVTTFSVVCYFSWPWLSGKLPQTEGIEQWFYVFVGVFMTLPVATPASMSSILDRILVGDKTRALLVRATNVIPFLPVLGAMILIGTESARVDTHWVTLGTVIAPVVVGVLLGLITAGLISRFVHAEQAWGVILGTTLLGAGFSIRMGLSAVATLFWLGLSLSMFPAVRRTLNTLTDATERPVLLPVALVLGASLRADVHVEIWVLFGVMLVLRTLLVLSAGWIASLGFRESNLGLGFGALLTMPAALPLALQSEVSLRGESAHQLPLLLFACAGLLVHEVFGQVALRRLDANERSSHLPPEPANLAKGPV